MEEEKFRKSGKRKYEQLTEKLINAANHTQQYSEGGGLVVARLSAHSQSILKGKVQERIELMHLHTTTHGTRRWSGEKEAQSPDENKVTNTIAVSDSTVKRPLKDVTTPRAALSKTKTNILGKK